MSPIKLLIQLDLLYCGHLSLLKSCLKTFNDFLKIINDAVLLHDGLSAYPEVGLQRLIFIFQTFDFVDKSSIVLFKAFY
jgi:hypothetical protein